MIALPAEDRWVCVARRFATALLMHWGVAEDDRDSILLIIGELAANAAQHGHADMTVGLTLEERSVRIQVADCGAGPTPVRSKRFGSCDEHGRGLGIVECLAQWSETRTGRDGWQARAGFPLASTEAALPGSTEQDTSGPATRAVS
ncbi:MULTISPECIES: ATP-binding protein [Streptomyces]|uniref:ATP-binding protein n=1 Tax=Streptomyces TaxID=1883 RepID=UPI00292DCEB0|nr:ATP-binding protein [Streptomyces sp. NEAU-HV9]